MIDFAGTSDGLVDSNFGKDFDRDGFDKDPCHQQGELWYFWDETWADRVGPFADEQRCRRALYEYVLSLGGE